MSSKKSVCAERNRSRAARLAKSRIAHCDNLRGVFVEFPIEPARPAAGEKETEKSASHVLIATDANQARPAGPPRRVSLCLASKNSKGYYSSP